MMNSIEKGTQVKKIKKVDFQIKPQIHLLVHWDYAYRSARRGTWEAIARDHDRFKHRIDSYQLVLNPILSKQHRLLIFNKYFQ